LDEIISSTRRKNYRNKLYHCWTKSKW